MNSAVAARTFVRKRHEIEPLGDTMIASRLRAIAWIAMGFVAAAPLSASAQQQRESRDLTVETPGITMHRPLVHRPPSHRPVVIYEEDGPVMVSMTPTASVVRIGTPIGFRLTSSRSGFGHLYILQPSGKVQLLFENVPVLANVPLRYPRNGTVVRATPPAGDTTLIFVTTLTRIDGFAGRQTTRTPFDLQVTAGGFRDQLAARTSRLPREAWGFTDLNVRVLDD